MKLTFLGTGTSQGVPVIGCTCRVCTSIDLKDKRLRCAAVIEHKNTIVLIDSGPDIRQQLIRARIPKLDGVLLTHEHYDHTGGLDDLRPFMFMQNQAMEVYAQHDVLEVIKTKYHYAFNQGAYPGAPRFNLLECKAGETFIIESLRIKPLKVKHGDLNILGFKLNDDLAYITDSNGLDSDTIEEIKSIPILVINALHQRPHHSHYTLDQTLHQIDLIHPKQAYLIHMSHHMGLHQPVQATLPKHVFMAFDTLIINSPSD